MMSKEEERYFAMFRRPRRGRPSLVSRLRHRLRGLTAGDISAVVDELLRTARTELENLSRRAERLRGILENLDGRLSSLRAEQEELSSLTEGALSSPLLVLLRIRLSEIQSELTHYGLLRMLVEDQLADVEYRMGIARMAIERLEELKRSGGLRRFSRLFSLLSPIIWLLRLFAPSLKPTIFIPLVAA